VRASVQAIVLMTMLWFASSPPVQVAGRTLEVDLPPGATATTVTATLGGKTVAAALTQNGARAEITFASTLRVTPGVLLEVRCGIVAV
jgi:hypothetical protein